MDLGHSNAGFSSEKKIHLRWIFGSAALLLFTLGWMQYEEYTANATIRWLKTNGTVLKSSYQYWPGSEHEPDMYIPDVGYNYNVGGKHYHSREIRGRGGRVYWYEISFTSEAAVNVCLEQFPPGGVVAVYYCPEDPTQSVLIRGLPPSRSRDLIKYGLAALMAVLLVVGLKVAVFEKIRWPAWPGRRP